MPQLQGQGLALVLSRLSNATDLLRTSLVNKVWAEASAIAQPISIRLIQKGDANDLSKLNWLQGLQQQGRLQDLQQIRLWLEEPDPTRASLSVGFMMLLGSCQIRECSVKGSYCFKTVLGLLPKTVQVLDLRQYPGCEHEVIHSSSFCKFQNLQSLRLGVHLGEGYSAEDDNSDGYMFIWDAPLPGLTSAIVQDLLISSLQSGCDIRQCLPNVSQLGLRIIADEQGAQLAQGVLSLPCLQKIRLDLLFSTETEAFNLLVPTTSLIEELLLRGSEEPRVSLYLRKAAISLRCSGVDVSSVSDPTDLFAASYRTLSCEDSL